MEIIVFDEMSQGHECMYYIISLIYGMWKIEHIELASTILVERSHGEQERQSVDTKLQLHEKF